MVDTVCNYLELTMDQVFYSKAPLDLSFLFALEDVLRKNPDLVFPKRLPQSTSQLDSASPIIPQILDHDVLLSYPYESIRPFLNMLSEAANDPKVVSILSLIHIYGTWATVVSTARQGWFLIPLLLILTPTIGILGIQIAQPLADIGTTILAIWALRMIFKDLLLKEEISE